VTEEAAEKDKDKKKERVSLKNRSIRRQKLASKKKSRSTYIQIDPWKLWKAAAAAGAGDVEDHQEMIARRLHLE